MRKVDLAYLAGIIDGEGTVTVKRKRNPTYYLPYVTLQLTNQFIPEWLHFSFGGSLRHIKRSERDPARKDVWEWRVHGKTAIEFLKTILPYLVLKKAHAELVIKIHLSHTPKRKLRPMDRELQELVASQIHELNK